MIRTQTICKTSDWFRCRCRGKKATREREREKKTVSHAIVQPILQYFITILIRHAFAKKLNCVKHQLRWFYKFDTSRVYANHSWDNVQLRNNRWLCHVRLNQTQIHFCYASITCIFHTFRNESNDLSKVISTFEKNLFQIVYEFEGKICEKGFRKLKSSSSQTKVLTFHVLIF